MNLNYLVGINKSAEDICQKKTDSIVVPKKNYNYIKPVNIIFLLCQWHPNLQPTSCIGDRKSITDFRDVPVLFKEQFQTYPVIQNIIDGRSNADNFLSRSSKWSLLIKFTIGSSIITKTNILFESNVIIQFHLTNLLNQRKSFFPPIKTKSYFCRTAFCQLIIDQAKAKLAAFLKFKSCL